MISIFVEGEETEIRKLLGQTPFDFVSADYQLWACSLQGHTLARGGQYLEYAATLPVRYKGKIGGFSPYMYCTCIDAILAGREIYGYPKRICEMDWIETPLAICAQVNVEGEELLKAAFVPAENKKKNDERIMLVEQQIERRLILKHNFSPVAEKEDKPEVLYRNLDRRTTSTFYGNGYVKMKELPGHFVHQLGIRNIIGSKFTISSYGGQNENVTILG